MFNWKLFRRQYVNNQSMLLNIFTTNNHWINNICCVKQIVTFSLWREICWYRISFYYAVPKVVAILSVVFWNEILCSMLITVEVIFKKFSTCLMLLNHFLLHSKGIHSWIIGALNYEHNKEGLSPTCLPDLKFVHNASHSSNMINAENLGRMKVHK